MKSFVRIKEVYGNLYAYEITPYYDKKTKNTKQKSRYLGVYKDGKIMPKRIKLPVCVFDYGEFLPFQKILDEMPVVEILKSFLSEKQVNTILALTFNRLIRPVAANNVRSWYEGTYLSKLYGDLPLSSQSISDFMGQIGRSSLARDFSEEFIKSVADGGPLLYDITSLSSASRLMDVLEWGYNRDLLQLPQLNLSIIAHKDSGIPLFFDVYPGSVADVTTLKNTIMKLDAFGLETPTLILDRGFFSETNILELLERRYNFIMQAPFSSKSIRSLAAKARGSIESPENLVMYNGSTVFVEKIRFNAGEKVVDGFIYYDLRREKGEKSLFYDQLYTAIDRLKKRRLKAGEKPSKVFQDISKGLSKYLSWSVRDRMFDIKVKKKAVAQRVNRMGFTVLLCQGGYGWEEALGWIRERDVIEKIFMRLKNDLEATPTRAQKTEVVKGWIFVTFLSLILRARLLKICAETGVSEKYSIPALLLVLGRLKKVELSDGSMIVTEVTKKQREIFEKMNLTP